MPKVFIIDDQRDQRQKYKKILKENQYEVVEAQDAIRAADIIMRDRSSIGLIVLDIQIPGVDGRDIFDIIHEYAPNIPIMVSSVLPLQDQKLKIPKARQYYHKHESEKAFLEKVNQILPLPTMP